MSKANKITLSEFRGRKKDAPETLMSDLMIQCKYDRGAAVNQFLNLVQCSRPQANRIFEKMKARVKATEGYGLRVQRFLGQLEESIEKSLAEGSINGNFYEFRENSKLLIKALGMDQAINLNQVNNQSLNVSQNSLKVSESTISDIAKQLLKSEENSNVIDL